jgi:hypothetical protein
MGSKEGDMNHVSMDSETNELKIRKSELRILDEVDDNLEVLLMSGSFESTESTQHSTDDSADGKREEGRYIFEKAREYLNPGRFFRLVVRLYAERKLLVFFWIHFVSTMVIWGTFRCSHTWLRLKPK